MNEIFDINDITDRLVKDLSHSLNTQVLLEVFCRDVITFAVKKIRENKINNINNKTNILIKEDDIIKEYSIILCNKYPTFNFDDVYLKCKKHYNDGRKVG